MKNEATLQIAHVLETSAGRVPEMTHALSVLGEGDMGAGLLNLWSSGQRSGMVKGAIITSLLFAAGIGVGLFFLHRFHEEAMDKLERETADMCLDFAAEVYERKDRKMSSETESGDQVCEQNT